MRHDLGKRMGRRREEKYMSDTLRIYLHKLRGRPAAAEKAVSVRERGKNGGSENRFSETSARSLL